MKILRVRLDAELGEGLDRLKAERYVNVSAWVRALIRPALAQQLGTAPGSVGTLPPSTPESPPPATAPEPEPGLAPGPIPGWTPRGLPDGSWGSRYQGDTRKLPDDLLGCAIEVTTQEDDRDHPRRRGLGVDRGFCPRPRFRETFAGVAAGAVFLPLREFIWLVSGSPWPRKRAVAPGGKSRIFHRGVGPGWGSSGDGELGSWSVCGPHLELVVAREKVRTLAPELHGLQRRKSSDRRLDTESAPRPPATSPGQNPEFGPDRALQALLEERTWPEIGQNRATSPTSGADLVLPVSYHV